MIFIKIFSALRVKLPRNIYFFIYHVIYVLKKVIEWNMVLNIV